MTTISGILNGAEQDFIARAADIALHGSSRYTKGRLTGSDFGLAFSTEVGKIANMEIDKVMHDSLAGLVGWRSGTSQILWDDLQKLLGAARETQHQPTVTRTVSLLEYDLSAVYEGNVGVYVVVGLLRHRVVAARMGMRVTLSIAEISCTVQRGLLTRVRGRPARIAASLYLNDIIEVGRETEYAGSIDIPLPQGIPLLPKTEQRSWQTRAPVPANPLSVRGETPPSPGAPRPPSAPRPYLQGGQYLPHSGYPTAGATAATPVRLPIGPGQGGLGGAPVLPKTNPVAVLSLVFAFLFPPAGIVLGHVARRQTRGRRAQGRDLATAGLLISYLFTGLVATACCFGVVILALAGMNAPTS